jgi:hypothetical protein
MLNAWVKEGGVEESREDGRCTHDSHTRGLGAS